MRPAIGVIAKIEEEEIQVNFPDMDEWKSEAEFRSGTCSDAGRGLFNHPSSSVVDFRRTSGLLSIPLIVTYRNRLLN